MSERLYDLDDDRDYIAALYRLLLDRDVDEGGLNWYAEELASGRLGRRAVLEQLLASPEGRARFRFKYPYEEILQHFVELFDSAPFRPWVSQRPVDEWQLCECADPRKWLDPEWSGYLESLGLSASPELMHRKGYEWAQTLYGLERLGVLDGGAHCLGVGSGHEAILYWLANRVDSVIATDLYDGAWANEGALEGDPSVLDDPGRYAPFPYREDRLRFLRMDGRHLEFDDDRFDFVFSLGSIEHFGGNRAAAASMREMARVCRPGGVVVVATELILNDRNHPEFFTIDELRDSIVAASGMKLVQEPRFEIPAQALRLPCLMPEESHRTPHLILDFAGVITTSVIFFFRHD